MVFLNSDKNVCVLSWTAWLGSSGSNTLFNTKIAWLFIISPEFYLSLHLAHFLQLILYPFPNPLYNLTRSSPGLSSASYSLLSCCWLSTKITISFRHLPWVLMKAYWLYISGFFFFKWHVKKYEHFGQKIGPWTDLYTVDRSLI